MIKWLLRRWIGKFERTWNYDASYLRDVLDADPRALMAFSKVAAISNYHKDVSPAAYVRPVLSAPCPRIAGRAPSL
jgi:hypothetical protein